MAYNVSSNYNDTIYSGETKNKAVLSFNGDEIVNVDAYLEKITITSGVLTSSDERFYLDTLIAKKIEISIYELDPSIFTGKCILKIGTLVDDEYEYVPMGVFNIQETPTNENNKTTITLRDNAALLDVGYNASTIMGDSGSATLGEILQNICDTFEIENGVDSFNGDDISVGIYDNSITGRTYVAYIAEQAGCFPTINRDGKLVFIRPDECETINIPISVVESYENGTPYKISRVVFEDAIQKYEAGDETNDTLYIDGSNPYVTTQDQVDSIFSIVDGFGINSFSTGKVLGNPAIDPYDLISITDYDGTVYSTLSTNTLTYSGTMTQTFETLIGLEEREENVTVIGDKLLNKTVKTEIDNIEGTLTLLSSETTTNFETISGQLSDQLNEITGLQDSLNNYATSDDLLTLTTSVEQQISNTYSKTEVQEIITGTAEDGTTVTVLANSIMTVDIDGLTMDSDNSSTKTVMQPDNFSILDKTGSSDTVLFTAKFDEDLGETVVESDNLSVDRYINLMGVARIEKYTDENNNVGVGLFLM